MEYFKTECALKSLGDQQNCNNNYKNINNNNNNNDNNNNNNNNLNPLLISKLAIKTYLQLVSLKKKNVQSKYYLQVISFHKLLFISIKEKFNSIF